MSTVQQQLDISRVKARQMGLETLEILKKGSYQSYGGKNIAIREGILNAVNGTVTYSPEEQLPIAVRGDRNLGVVISNVTSLFAAKALLAEGYTPAVLNFASATSPGGGFLSGARAQEEYLCRSSALFACLTGNPMYSRRDFHTNPFYADYVIYAPNVPVFRDDDGELIEMPYKCSFVTSPAVQASAVRRYIPEQVGEIEGVMWMRMLKILSAMHLHNHDALVLGAWGCGAFGNDAKMIARLFKLALMENFKGAFSKVVFAITDWSPEQRFIGPFLEVFN